MTRSPRTRLAVSMSIIALCAMTPIQSAAMGVGGYFEFLHGDGEIDYDLLVNEEIDFESNKFGFGVAIDSNLAKNRLFNYRGTFGYQRTNRDFDRIQFGPILLDLDDIDANGFTFNNSFGLAVSRGRTHRLWIGPSIRIAVDVFDTNDDDIDIVDVSVGGGPVLGLNLHAGRNFTIGLSTSYQYLYVGEVIDVDIPGVVDDTESFDGHEHLVTANVTLFFRSSGDQYERPPKRRSRRRR